MMPLSVLITLNKTTKDRSPIQIRVGGIFLMFCNFKSYHDFINLTFDMFGVSLF